LLESFRSGQRWLTLLFVAAIGGVFIFAFGSGGGGIGPSTPTGNAIVQLDDVSLMSRDLRRVQRGNELRLREQLGEAYDQLNADQIVASQSLSQLVNSVVIAAAAQDLGLHVTTDEVRRAVQTMPAFINAEGQFDPGAFSNFAQGEYGTQRNFIRSYTRDLLGQKLIGLLMAQTSVSDAEIDLVTRYELEEVRIAYVAIDSLTLPDDQEISDEDAQTWADENEETLRKSFAARAESLGQAEQIRARHILVQVPPGAGEEEIADAHGRAKAARGRIEAGEDFETVAAEVSDDVGTKSLGGDLGLFARGGSDAAIDVAAFSLEVGGLSEPVRSEVGWHVLRVDEKQAAAPATYEGAYLELAREAASVERAADFAQELADVLVSAVEGGASLEDAAREAGLTLERPPSLTRRPDGFVPGLGAAEALMTTVFTLEAGQSSPEVFDVAGRKILVQALERTTVDEGTVAARRADRREAVLAQKQNAILESWIADYRRQLEQEGRLKINAELALGS
jgi:peptidyl-prolyl cis-trans isomerase D